MDSFTPLRALGGGMLIGLACSLFFLFNGRIAGIAGLLNGLFSAGGAREPWRLGFLLGLVACALVVAQVLPGALDLSGLPGTPTLAIAGILVGVGTRVGRGCTSGHGVCGISRFSKRSIVATLIFMGAAMLTVFVTHPRIEQ